MWVELATAEIDTIISALGDGIIVDKLLARPPLTTGAFVDAAERKAEQGIVVENCGIIDRGDFGAYVLSWLWVTDAEAKVPTKWEEFGASPQLCKTLHALDGFGVTRFKCKGFLPLADGVFSNYDWSLEVYGQSWRLVAIAKWGGHPDWTYSEQRADSKHGHGMKIAEALILIERALSDLSRRKDREYWCDDDELDLDRRELEDFIYGEISADAVASQLNVDSGDVATLAEAFKAKFMSVREGKLCSAGQIALRIDDLDPDEP